MPELKGKKPRNEDFSKENRIKKELDRITEIFEEADENQRNIAKPLIQNAAFMKVTLEDLQEIINAEGVTDEYQNGANQRGIKQSATLQSYNALIKNYASVIKALAQIVPYKKTETLSPWLPKEKSDEELEKDREEIDRLRREDFELAVEYQREMREREKAGTGLSRRPSFGAWKAEKAKEKGEKCDGEESAQYM